MAVLWHGWDVERVTAEIPTHGYAPLREAIFELHVEDQGQLAQMVDPERIGAELPEFVHHRELLMDLTLRVDMKATPQPRAVPLHRPRIRQWDEKKTRVLQFTPVMSTYNVMGVGYRRFEDETTNIKRVVRFSLSELKPEKLAGIVQRYINAVTVPVEETDLGKFFPIRPSTPDQLRGHRPMSMTMQTADVKNGTVVVTLRLEKLDDRVATYVVDITARSKGEVPLDADAIAAWHESLHASVREAYKLSIAEQARSAG